MRILLYITWLLGSLFWLSSDHLIRDGDEEGHVGAAELLRLHLDGGQWLAFINDAWRGELGEYPPLYPALVGAWWWLCGSGQPGAAPVRAVNLLGLLLAAWATARLAARLQDARDSTGRAVPGAEAIAALTASAVVLTLPLANGLARHYMPEGLLVGWVALTVWAAVRASDRHDTPSLILLGAIVGLGMLIKQTFAPLVLLPLMMAGLQLRSGWLTVASVAALIAGPWYSAHWDAQSQYVTSSIQAGPLASALDHVLYYPATMVVLIAGPIATLAGTVGGIAAWRRSTPDARRALAIALAWILGLVILAFIPKKYPRLAAPIAPALALLAGVGAAHLRERAWLPIATVVCGAAWLAWTSITPPADPTWLPIVDEKCPQRWLRPANPDDMGLSAITAAVATAPRGPLAVAHAPDIPCTVQTTHPWQHHIEPYLRRAGVERDVVAGQVDGAAVQATFLPPEHGDAGDITIPSLDLVLRIETR